MKHLRLWEGPSSHSTIRLRQARSAEHFSQWRTAECQALRLGQVWRAKPRQGQAMRNGSFFTWINCQSQNALCNKSINVRKRPKFEKHSKTQTTINVSILLELNKFKTLTLTHIFRWKLMQIFLSNC